MPSDDKYECEHCDYWEAMHGIKDYHDEKFKKCMRCGKRVRIYRDWIEEQGI